MGKDRFLIGILVGIGVLVAAALILFFSRQGQVSYGDDSSPAGALQNYFVAIQKRDYGKAYSYVADQSGKPSLAQFREPFLSYLQDGVTGSAVEIGQTYYDEQRQTATINVTILNGRRDIFSTSTRQMATATLVQQNGAWKVTSAPYPYGAFDLYPKPDPLPLPSPTLESRPTSTY
jgi:hypothetical protein